MLFFCQDKFAEIIDFFKKMLQFFIPMNFKAAQIDFYDR